MRAALNSLMPLWHLACWAMLRWALRDMHPTDPRYSEVHARYSSRKHMLDVCMHKELAR
jgi:type IV secretory pathway TrbD component